MKEELQAGTWTRLGEGDVGEEREWEGGEERLERRRICSRAASTRVFEEEAAGTGGRQRMKCSLRTMDLTAGNSTRL